MRSYTDYPEVRQQLVRLTIALFQLHLLDSARIAIILADEPTGNLDSQTGNEIMKLMEDLHRKGNTIVLVTHEADIAEHAYRVVHIKDGVVASDERKSRIAPPE